MKQGLRTAVQASGTLLFRRSVRRLLVVMTSATLLGGLVAGVPATTAAPASAAVRTDYCINAHVEQRGWLSVRCQYSGSSSGPIYPQIGTTGQGLRMEAFQISRWSPRETCDVYVRAHVAGHGWLGWGRTNIYQGKDSVSVGTTGQARRLEALQFKFNCQPAPVARRATMCAEAHVAEVGWQGRRCVRTRDGWSDALTIGTSGQARAIEAVRTRFWVY